MRVLGLVLVLWLCARRFVRRRNYYRADVQYFKLNRSEVSDDEQSDSWGTWELDSFTT